MEFFISSLLYRFRPYGRLMLALMAGKIGNVDTLRSGSARKREGNARSYLLTRMARGTPADTAKYREL